MKYDIEERLIRYAVSVLDLVDVLPETKCARHLAGQLIRSGTAPALMYGEALSAESRKDFIHKMKLALKELRESVNCLKIIFLKNYIDDKKMMQNLLQENNELIAIFVRSVHTAANNEKNTT